jgi:hypothetical protein
MRSILKGGDDLECVKNQKGRGYSPAISNFLDQKEVSMKRIGILAFLVICALLFSAAPASNSMGAASAPDPGQKGPYEVGFKYFQLVDPSRNTDIGGRPIAVYVWYPADPDSIAVSTPEAVYPLDPYFGHLPDTHSSDWEAFGIGRAYEEPLPSLHKPFPLVMFSPGWGCPAYFASFTATRLASHGFVVAVPYHYGDGCWSWEPWDHLALACLNRPLDVSFVLDDLLVKNGKQGDLFDNVIRPDLIAAAGHSLGGYASMSLAGGDDSVADYFFTQDMINAFGPPPPETYVQALPDTRIKAIVPFDGSNQVLRFDELARITVPTMGVGEEWSTLASDLGGAWTSWQARQHAAIQGHPCYRVDVASAIHMTFTSFCEFIMVMGKVGLWPQWLVDQLLGTNCTTAVPSLEVQRLAAKYMIAFLKTNLPQERGYQNILTPGHALAKEDFIEFFVTEKRNPNSIDEDWPEFFVYFAHQPGSEQFKAEKNPAQSLRIKHMRLQ